MTQDSHQSNGGDAYTMAAHLCDDDGIVRGGRMHHGTDYPCTGHAHYAGEHIYCTGPAHEHPTANLPVDLMRVLRDQSIVLERDGAVWALIGREALRDA
jgi:hypothetical protein